MKTINTKNFILILIVGIFANIQSKEIDLRLYEKRLISQYGEDGVIEKIFQLIDTTNKYYVEFGAGEGHFCSNTKYLREKYGWTGLLLDGACYSCLTNMADNQRINLHKEFVTAENICHLFEKYNVPLEFDLISIDIDRNDFYVWKSLSRWYRPRIVIIEYNGGFNYNEDKVIKYSPHAMWDSSRYFGASILAFFNLGKTLGYSLIYDSEGVNLFFIRDDILESCKIKFKNQNNIKKLYRGTPKSFSSRRIASEFISSSEAIKN